MFRSRLTRSATIALTVTALGASTAGAMPADLRSPDAVSAGQPVVVQSSGDLRTPDARDHGAGRGTFDSPDVTVVKVADPQPVATGFDWGDAGIGAGGLLALVLIALGSTLAITHRRHGRAPLAG